MINSQKSPTYTIVVKNSKSLRFFGFSFIKTEYSAQMTEEDMTHKSPWLKLRFKRFDNSPLKMRYTTPTVERSMPMSCFIFIGIFKITKERTKIKTGIEEFIIRAFVAVVF